ncbi:MAG: Crp/Fnr family transcriptional regulator [Dehalococcoidia bacterium]
MKLFRREPPPAAAPRPARSLESKLGLLSASDLFRDLSEEQMRQVDQMTVMTTCPAGRTVYEPGIASEALFLLKQGRIQIYRLAADGRKLTIGTVLPGTAFGNMSFTGNRMLGGYAEATEDSTICVMSPSDIEGLIAAYPVIGIRLVQILAGRLVDLEARLEESTLRDVPSRVAAALVRAWEQRGDRLSMTHQELAETVGTHRETVTRALGDFRDRGLLSLSRNTIQIQDVAGLRAAAGDDPL